MKTKSFRKVLTTSATCIVLATSFAGGTLRVWAEQYYGWTDINSRAESPFFLYVTPKNNPKRELKNAYVVYCFNRDKKWPANWEEVNNYRKPNELDLPIYDKRIGTNQLFIKEASHPRLKIDMEKSLVAILSKGFPNNSTELISKYKLDNNSARVVTQLAIWYFSDSVNDPESVLRQRLKENESQALKYLISVGEHPQLSQAEQKQTLDIYVYNSGGYYGKDYQNLLGSSLVPKEEKPSSESVTQSNLILLEQNNHSDIISGGSGNTETEEDTPHLMGIGGGLAGESGENTPKPGETGGHSPIVEENYGSTEEFHGNSEIISETEDTNPGIILGGSGNVETHEDTRNPHLMGLGGGLAGESGETTPKPGQTGGHGPIIETTEDTQKGMSGQSGSTIESENTKKPEVMIGGQGQTIETTEDTQKGMSGQSGGTIESEDTKKPEVMIGGQGQIIDFSENTQSGMSGQSGDTTIVEDTKKSEIIIGGQGQIIDFSENTQPGMSGQSGDTTIVEDTKKPTPKPKPAPIVNDEKPNKGTHLPQTSEFKQLTLSIIGAMSMLLVLGLSLFKRPSKKD
ncbi:TPA: fibronectin binding protein [Streptococcus equi subsp. zooepidemicus]|uniref:thioester-forming surface-anchored protein n=1 Tax=Streptococcus equi TaxID=1336 RepID=UPI0024A7B4A4|nr:thioester-forming surface-anchored protein [Streptococcus equi]MDI5952188.1 thioester-forming surface-anchored protein [Streptococcus equi subsp. zooepidemicus]MDI6073817.1 thioester-forming surface-anchored protein [Streptococcus equi subsp. zooepidemicus]HEL0046488.1 fibronectin binding protein [Streptococcus equi subsp. zooepidemicus]HEL0131370.1 fibronectin binding protein [Streptococcus equi subsp. zooepidemicus]HEL0153123.1 fibronectin binding protein [Streptococcus equi subsp. zooepi